MYVTAAADLVPVSVLAWAAVTEHRGPGGLRNGYLILTVMEAEESKVQALVDLEDIILFTYTLEKVYGPGS